MSKSYLTIAAAALAMTFAACSSDDLAVKDNQPQVQASDGAIGFDAYMQRGVSTRTGATGDIKIDELKASGFGVFAYYTNNNEYDPLSIPNFMYNQKVEWGISEGYWKYSPVLYWPNEYGSNAISEDNDKVTFFAYAPYVPVVPSTGKITASSDEAKWGITGMSRNIASGDPLIKYLVSFDNDKKVDLCWGVCDDPQWNTINDGTKLINDVKGLPWLNVERPEDPTALAADAGQKVKFQFKHALAQLNVDVDAFVDGTNNSTDVDPKTKIWIRSITFTGFATKGTLNLNNTEANKAHWLDYNGTSDLESGEEVTIYDGRKDGKEGAAGGIATNEKVLGLNPQFIQDEDQTFSFDTNTWTATHSGVTKGPQNLFREFSGSAYIGISDKETPIYVIPTGEPVKVTIVYDVETPDENLGVYISDGKTPGSTIENRIEKEVNFGTTGMENGKKYTIHLHLGMNSVKLDADVTDWDETTPAQDIDLPSNTPSFAASTTSYNFNVGHEAVNDYAVTLYGFYGGESITPALASDPNQIDDAKGTVANAVGVVNATFDIAANSTVFDIQKDNAVSWTGNASGNYVKLNITQKAAPLALSATASTSNSAYIQLNPTGTATSWAIGDAIKLATDIKVIRNGVTMTYDGGTPAAGKFGWNHAEKKITLFTGEELVVGDVFVITVKAGDAPEETITVNVIA